MKLNYITLMVRDIEKSMEFYQKLVGLQVMKQLDLEMGKIRFMANAKGETMIELIEFNKGEKVQTEGLVMSYLSDENLETIRDLAINLGYTPSEIITQQPKPKYFTVLDPDGIVVEFTSFS